MNKPTANATPNGITVIPSSNADETVPADFNRREFFKLTGGVAAAASTMSGCIRKPVEHILPFGERPEDLIPGRPTYYATSMVVGGAVLGLTVESQDGRPIKIEGNPAHPGNRGSANAVAQGTTMELYAPERSRMPLMNGNEASLDNALHAIQGLGDRAAGSKGKGLALLLEWNPSPTFEKLLTRFSKRFPEANIYRHDLRQASNAGAGNALVGMPGTRTLLHPDKASVILSLDSDFLGMEGNAERNSRLFSEARNLEGDNKTMNRLYVVGPRVHVTRMAADNALRMQGSGIGHFLLAVANALVANHGRSFPAGWKAPGTTAPTGEAATWVTAVAKDLANAGKSGLIVVGDRQAPHVHALGHVVNTMLGSLGNTVDWSQDVAPAQGLDALAAAISSGSVQQLVMLGGNPAFTAPGAMNMATAIRSVPLSVHLGNLRDETSTNVDWHIPMSHPLESWSDLRSIDGTVGIQQPLIAPLHASASAMTVLARLVGEEQSDHALVQAHWGTGHDADHWRRFLTSGIAERRNLADGNPNSPDLSKVAAAWPAVADAPGATPEGTHAVELNITLDSKVLDGRHANNPWLQELPDPATKLTWDNALLIGVETAETFGLKTGDMVILTTPAGNATLPILLTPGTADNTVCISMGYGRTHAGKYGNGTGFDIADINDGSWIIPHATLQKTTGHHLLARTQQQGGMEDTKSEREEAYRRVPTFVRSTSFDAYVADEAVKGGEAGAVAGFVQEKEVMPADKLKSLWEQPNVTDGQQWGMTVDLSSCHGCGACVVACQAENNIPVVGKEDVLVGREMHWLRIDHYQTGPGDDIEHAIQPVACTHCETAPCENVCPVAATVHSPEGLNDMVYNRCIGTRYCANNCPFKVRRFNYFNFNKRMDDYHGELMAMTRNPDVTVRFRGVIEKCSYCVQRITEAKIEAKRDGDGHVPDGRIAPACEQTCASNAITFGDTNDKNSRVAALKASPRNYGILSELNLHSRTTYLANVRNPNPELVKS